MARQWPNWRHFVRCAAFLALIGTLPAGLSAQADATPDAENAPDIQVIDQTAFEPPSGRILGFSPSGRWLLTGDEDALCAVEVEGLAEHACALLESQRHIHVRGIAWSPDGNRAAFTEDSATYIRDSDLHVFDLESGVLTTLTDDGTVRLPIGTEDLERPIKVDSNPAWSPDGATIAFSRTVATPGSLFQYATTIQTIPAAGGEPQSLGIVSFFPFAMYAGLAWEPSGDHLLYMISEADIDDPRNGLWRLDLTNGSTTRFDVPFNEATSYAYLSQVSLEGDAIITYPSPGDGEDPPAYATVDADTQATEPFAPSTPLGEGRITNMVFSPDGTMLLYTVDDGRVIVHDRQTGRESELRAATAVPPTGNLSAMWATNNVVFAPSSSAGGVLLRISVSGPPGD